MGLYDRHYYRDDRPGAGLFGREGIARLRMVSVNTWIIIICVAVFVIDGFLPRQYWKPVRITSDLPVMVQLTGGPQYVEVTSGDESRRLFFERRVVDVSQRPPQPVGTVEYQYMPPLQRWLHFSTHAAITRIEFWRFIGFQFLHANLSHLVFNMLGLFFFGPIVEQHLGSKRYLAFYLLCGIFGALMFLLLNILGITATLVLHEGVRIPGFIFTSPYTPLVGASAGIFGVLMAGAYLAPRAQVLLFFIIPMQLRTLAYLLFAFAVWQVLTGGKNAGGEAGHLGGAIAGYYFIRRSHHLHGFFDFLGRADPTSHHYRRSRGAAKRPADRATGGEIDRILDKIKRDGLHSLTDEEKRILSEASRRGT